MQVSLGDLEDMDRGEDWYPATVQLGCKVSVVRMNGGRDSTIQCGTKRATSSKTVNGVTGLFEVGGKESIPSLLVFTSSTREMYLCGKLCILSPYKQFCPTYPKGGVLWPPEQSFNCGSPEAMAKMDPVTCMEEWTPYPDPVPQQTRDKGLTRTHELFQT